MQGVIDLDSLSNKNVKKRMLLILALIVFAFTAVFIKLIYIQIVASNTITARAEGQWSRGLPLGAMRGDIVDVNGVKLADSDVRYTLYARPNAIKDINAISEYLSTLLGLDKTKLHEKLSKKGVSEITVVKKLTKQQMVTISALNYEGIYFGEESVRYYPFGDFMSQVIGFTDSDNIGQSGVEQYYNKYLQGINGKILTETDLVGHELKNNVTKYLPSVDGMTTKLTLDYHIQSFAERAVKDAMISYSAKSASCIIINPDNGAIRAMAQAPSFDLNNVPRDNVQELFEMSKSTLISNVYEPGSTFKILTSAIGLEENTYPDSHRFYCNGARMVDGQRIKCWQSRGHGSQTFAEGVKNSCNCVFMDIATKVGTTKMYEYLRRFGVNEKTGVDMLGEASGLLLNEKSVKNVDIARIGFGQAIAVTPIALVSAVSACINGGMSVTPHLLESISDKNFGTVVKSNEKDSERIISATTSDRLKECLYSVVSEGSGKKAYVPGYKIGGKTGTAQKYANGGIAQGKYVSSFIGFTEANGEKYLCLMIVDEPQGYRYYGSLVAAPYVGEIFKNIFAYKNAKPQYTAEELNTIGKTQEMPNLVNMTVEEAVRLLKSLNIPYEYSGEGDKVTMQFPAPGATVNYNTVVYFELN